MPISGVSSTYFFGSQPTITLVVTPLSPSIPNTTPLGGFVATLQGVWSNSAPFTGNYFFTSTGNQVSLDTVFSITLNGDHSGNLIVNPAGPGVGSLGGTTPIEAIQAQQ